MNISEKGINLIKSFESCRLETYKAVKTEALYTIGWGHYGVMAGTKITQEQADKLFLEDIQKYVGYVNKYVTSFTPNQNQFDALVSFCYNCGAGNLKKLCSDRTAAQVAEKITAYNKSGGKVLNGLVKRRAAEKELFCEGMDSAAQASQTIRIGHASISETGASEGAPGDQTGKEVCIRTWYSKPWDFMAIHPDPIVRDFHARAVEAACLNDNIGYGKNTRNTLNSLAVGVNYDLSKVGPCNCDCSSLQNVAAVASGAANVTYETNGWYTGIMKQKLEEAGYKIITDKEYLASCDYCVRGAIYVKTGAHTVCGLDDGRYADKTLQRAELIILAKAEKAEDTKTQDSDVEPAQYFNKKYAGKYNVTAGSGLHLRAGAGQGKKSLVIMPYGSQVNCYGYYSVYGAGVWLYVKYGALTGFCSIEYLG